VSTRVRHFYWTGEGVNDKIVNFGDHLGPLFLKRFAGITAEPSTFADAELVTVGSILQLMPKGWNGTIAGAGKIRENSPWLPSRRTRIMALRGPLTARGIPGSYALGDPGILADELFPVLPEKRYKLGLLPHWSDTELTKRPEFLKYKPEIINPADAPLDVIRQIGQCDKIVTSSLHGAIVADSFGIPRRIEEMALTRLDSSYKFRDYEASLGRTFEPGKTSSPRYSAVEDLKHAIHDVFRSLRGELGW
jgi:pyruvyltransferase